MNLSIKNVFFQFFKLINITYSLSLPKQRIFPIDTR